MGRSILRSLLLFITLLSIGAGNSAALMLDNFDSPAGGQSVTIFNGTAGSSATSLAGSLPVPGNFRKVSIDIQSVLSGGNTTQGAVNTFTTTGDYQLEQSVLVDSFGLIIYDANSTGINFDFSGFQGLRLAGVISDFSTPFTITLDTFGGGTSSITKSILVGDLDFLFSDLIGTANIQDVDRITIKIDPSRGGDVVIQEFVALERTQVPEPDILLLIGSGLIGLVGLRRKFKK
jgi:hypothetical protein